MTVEQWLRGHFHGLGNQIEKNVLEVAAISPVGARPSSISPVYLEDRVEDMYGDENMMKSLKYALSTLYYSMSASITGGTKSERRGNRQISIGGYPLTTKDREAFRSLGDRIREELGADKEEEYSDEGGMFDAAYLRSRNLS